MMSALAAAVFVAQATAYIVAAYPSSATDPATAKPLASPFTYPVTLVTCNQAKVAEVLPIENPREGRFDDPANALRDCVLPIAAQFTALPVGAGHKAAYRAVAGATPGPWSAFTSTFAVTAAQAAHPCDAADITTATVVEGTRTLTVCHPGKDANGNTTTITGWAVYVDGVRSAAATVVAGASTNAAGLRDYAVSLPLTRGTRVLQIVALNAQGEAVKSASLTVTVTAPLTVPAVALIKGIA